MLSFKPTTEAISSSYFHSLEKINFNESNDILKQLEKSNHLNGILLYPKNSLKYKRIAKELNVKLKQQYGQWLSINSYQDETNYTVLIKNILGIQQSLYRINKLKKISGSSLQIQARRRQDIDFLVLLGSINQVELIYPQIKYWFAHNLPVYTGSNIYYADKNYDLDGLIIPKPVWFNYNKKQQLQQRHKLQQTQISESIYQKLILLASQSIQLITETQCLNIESFINKSSQSKNQWLLKANSGVFVKNNGN